MQEKKADVKFILGMIVLVAVIVLMAGAFWSTVADQAEKEKLEEQLERELAIEAITVYEGTLLKQQIFVDMDTREIFRAEVPSEGIYNRAGALIRGDVLEYGDMVRIYPEGTPVQEDIPVYPVKKMERLGRADLETAQEYQDYADVALHVSLDYTGEAGS